GREGLAEQAVLGRARRARTPGEAERARGRRLLEGPRDQPRVGAQLDLERVLRQQGHAETVRDHLHQRREARGLDAAPGLDTGAAAHVERLRAEAMATLQQQYLLADERGLGDRPGRLRETMRRGRHEPERLPPEGPHLARPPPPPPAAE